MVMCLGCDNTPRKVFLVSHMVALLCRYLRRLLHSFYRLYSFDQATTDYSRENNIWLSDICALLSDICNQVILYLTSDIWYLIADIWYQIMMYDIRYMWYNTYGPDYLMVSCAVTLFLTRSQLFPDCILVTTSGILHPSQPYYRKYYRKQYEH